MARAKSVGALNKRNRVQIEGFEELVRNLRITSDQARVAILDGAVNEGSLMTQQIMSGLAPRASGPPTHATGHGADHITISSPKRRSRRDARAKNVGPSWRRARHLNFAEYGGRYTEPRPFVMPTFAIMKKLQPKIVAKHMRKVLVKAGRRGRR